jgi:hypothetical protein
MPHLHMEVDVDGFDLKADITPDGRYEVRCITPEGVELIARAPSLAAIKHAKEGGERVADWATGLAKQIGGK